MGTVIRWRVDGGQVVELRPSLVIGGGDFGFSNPTALEVWLKLGGIWLGADEWYEVKADSNDIWRAFRTLTEKYGVERWWADSEDPREIVNLQKKGIPVIANEIHDLDYGNRTVYGLLKQRANHAVLGEGPRLRMSRSRQPALIREFGLYAHHQVRGEVQLHRNPVDRHNHALAATRYAMTNEGEIPPEDTAKGPQERPRMYVGDDGRWHDDPQATQAQVLGPKDEGPDAWWDERMGGRGEHALIDHDI